MKKKSLDEEIKEKFSKPKKPVLVNWGNVRTVTKLNALIEEYGEIFIINPNGLPLKVTKAELT